jgi:hypothetical protein
MTDCKETKGKQIGHTFKDCELEEQKEEVVRNICKFCLYGGVGIKIDIWDTCKKYFCIKSLGGKWLQYECNENDLSYHQFCGNKCRSKWWSRYTFPCAGRCIVLLSRHNKLQGIGDIICYHTNWATMARVEQATR